MTATTPNPWLSRLAGKTSEEMAAEVVEGLSTIYDIDLLRQVRFAIEAIQAFERERAADGEMIRDALMEADCPDAARGEDSALQHYEELAGAVSKAIRALSPAAQGKSGGER